MENKGRIHFYFGPNSEMNTRGQCAPGCRFSCYEWSDGRLCCSHNIVSVVQKSRRNGQFIWYTDYVDECTELGEKNDAAHYEFHDLREAFYQLTTDNEPENRKYVKLLLEIIHAYNDKYHCTHNSETYIPATDIVFFVNCVLEIQKFGKNILSPSIRAELYRQIGMYAKCFEFESWAGRNDDEREIMAEVMFRAAHYDSKPFIIEHCEYCKNDLRFKKRTICPMFGL